MPLQRERQFIVRFSDDEAAELRKRSAAAGESVARYIRRRALESDGLEAQVAKLTEELDRLGEMREQYENLHAILAHPNGIPQRPR